MEPLKSQPKQPDDCSLVHFKEGGVMIKGQVVNSIDAARHEAKILWHPWGVEFWFKGIHYKVYQGHIKSVELVS